MAALGIIGIIVGVAVLIYGAYKRNQHNYSCTVVCIADRVVQRNESADNIYRHNVAKRMQLCNCNAWTSIDGMCHRCIVQCKWCGIIHRKRII